MVFMSNGLAVCLYTVNGYILLPDQTGVEKQGNKTDSVLSGDEHFCPNVSFIKYVKFPDGGTVGKVGCHLR